jgi:hypothetical protein
MKPRRAIILYRNSTNFDIMGLRKCMTMLRGSHANLLIQDG